MIQRPRRLSAHRALVLAAALLWLGVTAAAAQPHLGLPSAVGAVEARPAAAAVPRRLNVASFNIQFLGQFKNRDDKALADLLVPYDLIFVQELVAPPYPGAFPNHEPFRPDVEAARFFDAMKAHGFQYVLSEEDTGTGSQMHVNSSATEWFVAFYRPGVVRPASDLVTGFLGDDRYDHPDYERVPYAFGFRAGSEDLVFISVHLQPGGGTQETARRAHEIASIASWIQARSGRERDYVILGDMNIEDCDELSHVLPTGYTSLNDTCLPTNTNVNGPKPYDHVMYRAASTRAEIPTEFNVINLIAAMASKWDPTLGPYPGAPYRHDAFRTVYSDHNPVAFHINIDGIDDDP